MKSKPVKPLTEKELVALGKSHAAAMSPNLLAIAAERSKISTATLQVFGIGYSSEFGVYTFPMVSGKQELTGFATWHPDRANGIIPGSRLGLFIPQFFDVPDCCLIDAPQLLVIPQGPIDACHCREVGFMGVIGRPLSTSCGIEVAAFLEGHRPQEVIIVLPAGEHTPGYAAGVTGAMALVETLVPMVPAKVASVRLLCPPIGKTFREACPDFPRLAAYVLAAKTMTKTRIEAGRAKLAKMEAA